MIVKWNTHQICLDITWQECMSSFLSFIFVIRICDFAAKEACNVVEKWKWNCVGDVQFPLTEWHKLQHACSQGTLTTGLRQQDPGTDICQNNFPQHIKMFLSLLCYSDVFGNHILENGNCQRIVAIPVWTISRENIFPIQAWASCVLTVPNPRVSFKISQNLI